MIEYISMEEFKKKFLPETYREDLMESMSPEELTKFMVDETLEEVRQKIKEKDNE